MSFIIENEQTMLLELLEIVEKQLDIDFSPSEHKTLFEYMKNNPNADPKKILDEILTLAEKKLNKKITDQHKREIDSRCRNTRILERMIKKAASWAKKIYQSPKKEPPKKFTDKEIKRIIDEAEKKLLDKKILKRKIDDKGRQKVETHLKTNTKENDTSVDIANRAILGVISVGVTGGVQIVVLQNLGNPLIPDQGSFHNNTDNNTIINQSNSINFSKGDNIGTKCHEVTNVINTGNIDPMFVAKLDGIVHAEELGTAGTAKSPTPVPTPYGSEAWKT